MVQYNYSMVTSVLIVLKHLIYGGTERYALNLANKLSEKGIQVTLISGDGPLAEYVSPKVNLFIMPISRKPRIKYSIERKILELAKACKPQIIHAQCRTSMVCSQLARVTLNIPLVTHEHHMYDNIDYPFIVGELRDGAEKIITIGPYTKRKLVTNGLKTQGIVSILNGVDVKNILSISLQEKKYARKSLHLSSRDKIVLCFSRLEPAKNIARLVIAFIQIAKKIPQAKLLIVGDDQDGSTKSYIQKIIEENRLQEKVFLIDGTYDIRKYHAVADVFCYPPLGKGMAVMEAMAAGLPIVGKRTNRMPFVMEDGVSGFMTDATSQYKIDSDEIAEKLLWLLERPDVAKQMGKAGRARIEEKFTLEKVVSNILSVYEDVLNDHKTKSRTNELTGAIATPLYLQ